MSTVDDHLEAFRAHLRGRLLSAGGQGAVALFEWSGTKDKADKLALWLNRQLIDKTGGRALRVGMQGVYADLRHVNHQGPDSLLVAVIVVLPLPVVTSRPRFLALLDELRPEVDRRGGKNLRVFHLTQ